MDLEIKHRCRCKRVLGLDLYLMEMICPAYGCQRTSCACNCDEYDPIQATIEAVRGVLGNFCETRNECDRI